MINAEELAICRRRGHNLDGEKTPATDAGWQQCESCGLWLRQDSVTVERADTPPREEINPFELIRWSDDRPSGVNEEELAVCRRRKHNLGNAATSLAAGWTQCASCGLWLRKECVITEREDDPPEAEIDKRSRHRL
jgi:hypothetical protein